MSQSEDDTFDALLKPEFEVVEKEIRRSYRDWCKSVTYSNKEYDGGWMPMRDRILSGHGWTFQEYYDEKRRRDI